MAVLDNSTSFLIVSAIIFITPAMCAGDSLLSLFFGTRSTTEKYATSNWRNFRDRETEELASKIRMKIYTGRSIGTATSIDIPVQEAQVIYNYIDHSKPLVLHIHGYQEHPSNESIRTIVGAHLERGTDNIMVFDWSDLAFNNYIILINLARDIARVLTRTFDDLVLLGLDLETFHLVSHSLGSQIGAFFGKYSKHSIPRITALDPAKPGFYHPGAEHIDASSARFVDVIHTDGGFYGALSPTGTVDFFANGGSRPQPGCPLFGIPLTPKGLCSHWRSWRYYAESVLNEFAFPAVQCPSHHDFNSGKCSSNRRVFVGYATPTDTHGSFYFTTNDKSPFGAGAINFTVGT